MKKRIALRAARLEVARSKDRGEQRGQRKATVDSVNGESVVMVVV